MIFFREWRTASNHSNRIGNEDLMPDSVKRMATSANSRANPVMKSLSDDDGIESEKCYNSL